MEGYRRALIKHALTVCPRHVLEAGYQDQTGHEAMRRLLQTRPVPDGVFCYNDPVAIGAMRAISEAGLRVPEDIAVVGAGNVHYSDCLAVPLTTVDQGTFEIGKLAADLLLQRNSFKERTASAEGLDRTQTGHTAIDGTFEFGARVSFFRG